MGVSQVAMVICDGVSALNPTHPSDVGVFRFWWPVTTRKRNKVDKKENIRVKYCNLFLLGPNLP